MSVLDGFFWQRGQLAPLEPTAKPLVDLSCVVSNSGGSRQLKCSLPFFVRNLAADQLEKNWVEFCVLLSNLGVPFCGGAAALESVPLKSTPTRFARIELDGHLSVEELTTCDAIEIDSFRARTDAWGWRAEVGRERLPAFVDALRCATGGDAPIGISLPMDVHAQDLASVVTSGVDFVTLVSKTPLDLQHVSAISRLRRVVDDRQQHELSLIVDAPLASVDEVAKLLALGASLVVVDSELVEALPVPRSVESVGVGMLSGIAGVQQAVQKNPLYAIEAYFAEASQTIAGKLRQVGVQSVRELSPQALRTHCSDLAEFSGVLRLET